MKVNFMLMKKSSDVLNTTRIAHTNETSVLGLKGAPNVDEVGQRVILHCDFFVCL